MRNKVYISLLFIIIIFNSCSKQEMNKVKVPVRSYIIKDKQNEEIGFGAYGYVLLPKDNNSNDEIYIETCNSFKSMAKILDTNNASTSLYFPTYWMLKRDTKDESCINLLNNYDYLSSKIILSYINENFQHDLLSKEGPILVAFEKPFSASIQQSNVLILDLSNLTKFQIKDAFLNWQRRIVLDSKVWNDGLKGDSYKLKVAAFFDKYGSSIMKFLSKS